MRFCLFRSNRICVTSSKHLSRAKSPNILPAAFPILVHAPSYSTVAQYCREHGCGLVVDEPNEALLRDALMRLINDTGLRQELSTKALETARKDDAGVHPAIVLKAIVLRETASKRFNDSFCGVAV